VVVVKVGLSFARRHALGAAALFIALGGTSYAVTGDMTQKQSKTYYACVTARFHTLNLSTEKGRCASGERKISFSAAGPRGEKGAAGARGLQGLAGPGGPSGAKGDAGEQGPPGPTTSVLGSPGSPGAKGEKGDTGDKGAQGIPGPIGLQGPKGDTGAAGPQGPKGDNGAAGPQGLKGDTGATGAPGSKGDTGATGAPGSKGDTGATGAPGLKGDTGAPGPQGAKGDKGDTGATGPAGPEGGGVRLIDGNNVTLGTVIASGSGSATVLTSTGYQIDIPFDGKFYPAQIYYSGGSCSGTAYLNDGQGGTPPFGAINGKWVVYSGSLKSLMAPAAVSNGVATAEAFTAATIDNPDCGADTGTRSGWKLTPITRSAAGLPDTIATPLHLQ
jgi:hypothetical protein